MATVTIEVPEGALSALRLSPAEFVNELRLAAALLWYSQGDISQSKGAEIAGTSRAEFIDDAHHHSGLSYLTPADVHYGRAPATLEVRHRTRVAASAAHPQRFVQGPPRRERLPHAAWINPPAPSTGQNAPGSTIVTPVDPPRGE